MIVFKCKMCGGNLDISALRFPHAAVFPLQKQPATRKEREQHIEPYRSTSHTRSEDFL
jgi:hypothetical protein